LVFDDFVPPAITGPKVLALGIVSLLGMTRRDFGPALLAQGDL
jgi:hypothetical protein